jgi:DNA-binding NtrC family response regulator
VAPPERQIHILVVEDELFIRMFISEALRDEGFTVIEAFNADEAMNILAAGKSVDLIFSDVRMPGTLDGIGLLRSVSAGAPNVPVILTSGHLDPAVAIAEGASRFLRKPYDIQEVLDLVAFELEKPTK